MIFASEGEYRLNFVRRYQELTKTETASAHRTDVSLLHDILGESWDSSLQCKKCKSQNVQIIFKQTRSADEGMTTFFLCQDCNYRSRNEGL